MNVVFSLNIAVIIFPLMILFSVIAHAENIEEMTITAYRNKQKTRDFAGSIDLLNKSTLKLTEHLHIQESLNRLAGVNFHRNDGQEYLSAIRSPVLTGPGSCGSVMTMEDGLSLRPVGFCNVNELFESHSEQATRIDVIRGPGTSVFGSKALHGVINVIDVAPLNEPTKIKAEVGADDFGRLSVSKGSEIFGFSFTGASDGGYRDDSGNDQQKFSLRHLQSVNDLILDTRLTATNLNQETAGFLVGNEAYRDENLVRTNPNPEAFRDAQSIRFSTKITHDHSGWQVRPYARYSDMTFLQHFLPGQPLEENGHQSVGVLSQYRFDIGEAVTMTTGIDLEYANSWLRQFQENPTQGSDFLQETIPSGLHYDYEVQSRVIGPYAQFDWVFGRGWNLGTGLRLERVTYDYDNLMIVGRTREDGTECGFGGCRYSRPDDQSDSFNNVSPKLTLSYQFSSDSIIYFNHSTGFRAPEMTELYRLQRDQLTSDLDSEKIQSIQLGVRKNTGSIDYDVELYAYDKSNVIFRDIDFFNVSDGETKHEGIEASIDWSISEWFNLAVAGSYARHQYANNPGLSAVDIIGNDIDTAPRRLFSSQLTYKSNGLALELEWQNLGAYYTDPENLNRYDGHDLVHFRLLYDLNNSVQLSLRLNNVFDTNYAERADFSGFDGDRYFPGLPRRIYVGIQYQLGK